jgi:PAS domain S-box-containing protein
MRVITTYASQMQNPYESRKAVFQRASRFCGPAVAALGAVVLIGWALDVASLKGLRPGLATMKANTAMGFLLAGVALFAIGRVAESKASAWRLVHSVLATAVMLLGLLTVGEYVLAQDLGIDQLIFTVPPDDTDHAPGRMAFATALGFTMTGLALLLVGRPQWVAGQAAALVAHLIGLLAVLGYLHDVTSLYAVFAYSSMAVHTALGFMVVTAGVLMSRPQDGLMGVVVSETSGGLMARRLLPLAVFAPVLITWVSHERELQGLQDARFGAIVEDLVYIVLFGILILRTAHVLRRGDERYSATQEMLRRQAAQLSERETQLRLFIEHAPASLAMFDRDMRYLAVSHRWMDDYGLDRRDILGHSHYEIFPDIPETWREVHRRGLAGEIVRANEDRFERADGKVHWVRWEVRPWRLTSGEVGGIVIFTEEISDLKQAEQNLRISQQDLQHAQTVGKIGSWRLDVRRNQLTWSPENHRIFGVPEGTSMTYEFFLSCVHPEDRAYVAHEWAAALKGKPYDVEHRLLVNGQVKWVRERAELELGDDGSLLGGFGTTQDINDRKALEASLLEARDEAQRQTRAKSLFLATMSHEIRTPLSVIIGLGYLLRRDITNPMQARKLDQLCAHSDHLLALVSDVLDLSKIESEELALSHADFLLGTVIKQVTRLLEGKAHDKGLRLTTDVSSSLPGLSLEGDALRLAQVLINLCGNAIKFTRCGSVCLSITRLDEDDASVRLRFSVSDTGCGIAPEDQAHLFQPFVQLDGSTTRNHDGTGLGLAISQRLVALMGGRIKVESQLGVGSTFSFDIVLKRAAARADAVPAPASVLDFRSQRVLFAEDHPQSQEIVLEMLEDLGCEVDVAGNGAEAVECAQARAYDLILMDMQMPRMDGISATGAIRALPGYGETPIIAMTANAFAEDRQRCLAAGMTDHLAKPVTAAVLTATLGKWLPAVAAPPSEAPCGTPLAYSLQQLPGLEVASTWLRSPERAEAYCEHVERFATGHAEDMSRLCMHLASGKREAARGLAHNLKGMAGLIGATRIALLAGAIEQILVAGLDTARARELADECEAELANLAHALRNMKAAQE